MKRILSFFLLMLLVLSTIGTASAESEKERRRERRKRTKEIEVEAAVPGGKAIRAPMIAPERKQQGALENADGDDIVSTPGGSRSAPPMELVLKRGASRVFDVRALPQVPMPKIERPERELPEPRPIQAPGPGGVLPPTPLPPIGPPTPHPPAPPTIQNFVGLDFNTWGNGHPPDTVGDVGPSHYIESINTSIGIYDKVGNLISAFNYNTFMSQGAFGNLCDTNNFGDPVVLYDTFEDRWIITDFAFQLSAGAVVNPPGAFQCIAASKTNDPVAGGWNFYSINVAFGLGDYPKFGIWPDGLYMTTNVFGWPANGPFQNARAYAFNKAQMYAGAPNAQVVAFDISFDGDNTVLPSNARLQTGTPPPGTPNYYVSTAFWLNAINVYKFHVDWDHISLSTFTGPDVPLAATSWPNQAVAQAPSQGGNNLDTLGIRAMMQNQYTNFGGVESLWTTHTVRRVLNGTAAPRWYQANVTGGTVNLTLVQGTTWDPDAANTMNRFMPSLAVDRAGNMALGYSTSNSTNKPAIKYAGRLAADPINTFSQTEQLMFQGAGTQTGLCGGATCTRWGDYSAMSLDPDGCTFWYTNMYYAVDGLNHQTRVASFQFPGCTPVSPGGGTLSGTVTALVGGAPISGATVQLGSRTASTNGSGFYTFLTLPAGTYPELRVSKPGFISAVATNIGITDGNTTTQNFALANAPTNACLTDSTQSELQTGVPTNVDLVATPNSAVLSNGDPRNAYLTTSGTGFNVTNWLGQTFTPVGTGQATQVDVNLFCSGCTGTTPNLTVSIRATAAGLPTGPDLATATIPGFSNGGVASYFSAVFGAPATLTGGTMYAFVIRPVANPSAGTYALTRSAADHYPGGTRVSGATSGTVWSIPLTTTQTTDAGFRVFMARYFATGNLVSSVKDANPSGGITPIWGTLSWNATIPANTSVQFQVAASNSATGPFNFVGPDNTAGTFFTTSPASLSQFYNQRYLRYKAYLGTTDQAVTATLDDVTICFADVDCSAPISITPTPASVCESSTGNTASGPAGASSYAWSITNGTITSATNIQTITYNAGTSGNVGLMLTIIEAGGCHKSASINVPINPIPATPTATNTGPYCDSGSGVTVQLNTAFVSGAIYAWTGPNGFTSAVQNPTRTGATPSDSGLYSVTVTVSGCTSAAGSTQVDIYATPATPTATNTGPYCDTGSGVTVQLNTAFVSGATYSWTGPTGFTSALQNPTRSGATPGDSGLYSVTVTVNGCTSAAGSTQVDIYATPATPTATNGGPYCEGQTIQLNTPTVVGATYAWTGPGGFTSSLQNPTRANALTFDAGSYSVTVTVNGCTSAAGSTTVVVNTNPATPTATNTGPYCDTGSGVTVQLNTPTIVGATYSWTGPTGFTSALQNPTRSGATPADSGSYSVTVTVNGCTSLAGSTTVNIYATPATPTATNTGPYCDSGSGVTIQLNTPTVVGATYSWTGPTGFTSALQNPTRAGATAADAGSYSVTVTVNGCTSAAGSTTVVINNTPATPTATNGGPYCEGQTIQLNTPTVVGATYAWTGPAGFTSSLQNPTRANALTFDAGSYSVTVTVNGCTSAAGSTTVVVNTNPATPTATNTGPYCNSGSGVTVQLNTPTVAGATYAWTGPTGFTSSLQNPTRAGATAADAGSYSVTVTVNGCTSLAGSTTVVINNTPATPTATNGGPYCDGQTIQLNTPTVAGATYAWTGPGGFTSSLQNPTRAATGNAGSYSVTVTVNGCTSAAGSTTVVVNPNPDATITSAASVPAGSTGNAASVANAGAGATYNWSIVNGTITGGTGTANITYTAGVAGTLTLQCTVTTSAGCSDTKSKNVTVTSVTPAPTITSVVPAAGKTTGGKNVTINGTGFQSGATIKFDTSFATSVVFVNSTKLTAKTPAHAAGFVNVTVTNPDTQSATAPNAYKYVSSQFDANGDNIVDPSDIFYLVNYLFLSGPPPAGASGMDSGDANGDGVVDPSDIFYIVSYLFLGGPAPAAEPSKPAAELSVREPFAGSVTLGEPVLRGRHYFIPVIVSAAPGSDLPQALSLRAVFGGDALRSAVIRRAGNARDLEPAFEISRDTPDSLAYLLAFDPSKGFTFAAGQRSGVIAEIEVDAAAGANISIGLDPALTMLVNAGGTRSATVSAGTLRVQGTALGKPVGKQPRKERE